jgi:hypothetical protein
MSGMSIQCPFSGGTKVAGTLSIAALRASYAVAFSTDPSKELLPGLPAAQTALRVGSQKVCNFHPPETVRFTFGVDSRGHS